MTSSNDKNKSSQDTVTTTPDTDDSRPTPKDSSSKRAPGHQWFRNIIDGTVVVAVITFAFAYGRLHQTVTDLKDERDRLIERHERALDDIAKAKTQALAEVQADSLRYTNTVLLNRGTTVLDLEPRRGGQLVTLRLAGDQYDYRYWLAVVHEGYGGRGHHHVLATLYSRNEAALGAPAISVDNEGNLHLTNEDYPHRKIKAHYSVLNIGN